MRSDDEQDTSYPSWDTFSQETEENSDQWSWSKLRSSALVTIKVVTFPGRFLKGRVLTQLVIGALIAVFIASLFSPFVTPAVTSEFVDHRVPGFEPGEVATTTQRVPSTYVENETVDRYGGVTWDDSYGILRLEIENIADRTVNDYETEVRLPTCVVTYTQLIGEESNVRVTGAPGPTLRGTNVTPPLIYDCTVNIDVDEVDPGESIIIEIVHTRDFDRCTFLHGYDPNRTFTTTYQWSVNGVVFESSEREYLTGLETEFDDPRSVIENASRADQRRSDAYVIGVQFDHPIEAYETCG